jgi:hypothetical protein
VAGTLIAVASAIVALITFDKAILFLDLPLALLLVLFGVFGAAFSAKHYERASMHTERARHYRDAVDLLLGGTKLKDLKAAADAIHNKTFRRLHRMRLHKFWIGLYIFIALSGIILSAFAVSSKL